MPAIDPIFVSVHEAALALGLSTWTVYKLLDAGAIACQYHGSRRLVVVESLRAYAAGLPTEAPSTDPDAA